MKFLLKYWKVCLIWLLIAIAIGYWVWNISEEPSDKIKNVIASISALAVSSALLLNAVSIFQQAVSIFQQSEMSFQQGQIKKFDETFALISKWGDEHFLKARDHTRKQQDIHKDAGTQQILDEINNSDNEDLKRSIIMMMDYFELIETSIQNDRIYENIIMEHFAHLLKDIIDRYECFLEQEKDVNPIGYKNLMSLKKKAEDFIENKKS